MSRTTELCSQNVKSRKYQIWWHSKYLREAHNMVKFCYWYPVVERMLSSIRENALSVIITEVRTDFIDWPQRLQCVCNKRAEAIYSHAYGKRSATRHRWQHCSTLYVARWYFEIHKILYLCFLTNDLVVLNIAFKLISFFCIHFQ